MKGQFGTRGRLHRRSNEAMLKSLWYAFRDRRSRKRDMRRLWVIRVNAAARINGLSYSKLLRFKAGVPEVAPADNAMEPDLAEKLPEQPDPLTYTFKLKANAKFHNGRAVTSEDIRYAYDRYLNYEKSVHKSGLGFIDKIDCFIR